MKVVVGGNVDPDKTVGATAAVKESPNATLP